jgi:hypothetical protein
MCTGESIQNWLLLTFVSVYFLGLLGVPGTEWIVVPVNNGKGWRFIVPSAIVLLLLVSIQKTLEFFIQDQEYQFKGHTQTSGLPAYHTFFWQSLQFMYYKLNYGSMALVWNEEHHALKLALMNNGHYYLFFKFTERILVPVQRQWQGFSFQCGIALLLLASTLCVHKLLHFYSAIPLVK